MFLDYGGDKRFIVKGYVDASFDTDPDDSKSQSGYILKVIQICKILTDLNVADLLTKLLSQAKHDHTSVLFGC